MERLRVEEVTMAFGGMRALDGVSFSAAVGERLGIIGPNGAGKSTLFSVLSGERAPTSGRTFFEGKDITSLGMHERVHLGIGRSFQLVNLFASLTVVENMLLGALGTEPERYEFVRPAGWRREQAARVEAALTRCGLWDRRFSKAGLLSYGEQRRLEFALSLMSQPKLVLLDEPGAGLSSDERAEVGALIRGLGPDVTTIVVDHDMDLLFSVAERVIVLHYGVIVAEGSAEYIKQHAKVQEIYLGEAQDAPA